MLIGLITWKVFKRDDQKQTNKKSQGTHHKRKTKPNISNKTKYKKALKRKRRLMSKQNRKGFEKKKRF